jgi:malonate decarboxylase gamma subunit
MPLTSIARITKLDIDWLQELAESNPVFAAGPDFFYRLGGIDELIDDIGSMRARVIAHVAGIREKKAEGRQDELGPWGRGALGVKRGGRLARAKVMEVMDREFAAVAGRYLS